MKREEFNNLLQDTIERVNAITSNKGKEYATDIDELHNFKKSAVLQGISQMEALSGMMAKHTISIYDMINDEASHPKEKWDEKIIDHIIYLILLRAIVYE